MIRRLALVLVLLASPLAALGPDEILPDPALEARARALSRQLRCLVCQTESIDDSNAELARDLRLLVRRRLVAGESDAEVLAYIHARYGDYVLMRPPVLGRTALLWFGPFLLLVGVGGWLVIRARRGVKVAAAPAPLTPAEQERLRRLEQDS
ncbi:MAG: cytochrome c-type biogenesis protein [Elstera sp.]